MNSQDFIKLICDVYVAKETDKQVAVSIRAGDGWNKENRQLFWICKADAELEDLGKSRIDYQNPKIMTIGGKVVKSVRLSVLRQSNELAAKSEYAKQFADELFVEKRELARHARLSSEKGRVLEGLGYVLQLFAKEKELMRVCDVIYERNRKIAKEGIKEYE